MCRLLLRVYGRRSYQMLLNMKSNKYKTKRIAISAMLTALCCVILSLGTILESLDLTFAAIAALIIWFVLLEFGRMTAWSIYIPTALISTLFLPSKFPALFFTFVTGWYPMLKFFITRKIKSKPILWLVKIICFNAVSLGLIFGVEFLGGALGIVFGDEFTSAWLYTMLILCNIAFLVTDILMDRLVVIYIHKIRDTLVKLKIVEKKQNTKSNDKGH